MHRRSDVADGGAYACNELCGATGQASQIDVRGYLYMHVFIWIAGSSICLCGGTVTGVGCTPSHRVVSAAGAAAATADDHRRRVAIARDDCEDDLDGVGVGVGVGVCQHDVVHHPRKKTILAVRHRQTLQDR